MVTAFFEGVLLRLLKKVGPTLLALLILAGAAAAQNVFLTGQAATRVVGQLDFSLSLPGFGADQLGSVSGVTLAGNRLIVSDGGFPFAAPVNNRLLIYNQFPAAGTNADVVVGQPNFGTQCGSNNQQACTTAGAGAGSLNQPLGVSSDGQRLVVADSGNHRVLIFNSIPGANGASANVVVGQPDFTTNTLNTSQTGLRGPNGVFLAGGRLLVADTLNHRVLIFNSVPTSNNARADVVLGQKDFNSRLQASPPSQTTMLDPVAVTSDGVRLVVTDLGNNRVLIFNQIPTSNGAAADVVLGQPDFASTGAGKGGAALNFPRYAYSDGTRLYIADTGNNRVLIYNQIPTENGAPADEVLGQRDFDTTAEETNADQLTLPVALAPTPSGLLVADAANRRVLEFRSGLLLFRHGAIVNSASLNGNGMAPPGNVSAQADTATGTIPAGTYYIKVTALSAFPRESVPSQEIAVDAPDNSEITVTWDPVPKATSYRVYAGIAPGLENRSFLTGAALATAAPIVFAGTPSPGDTTTITITKSDGNTFSFTYTVQAGDGLAEVANAVAAGINTNSSNDSHGVTAASDGTSSVTLTSKEPGTTGAKLKYSATATGMLTVSPTGATNFAVAAGAPPVPTLTFTSLKAAPSSDVPFGIAHPLDDLVPGSIVSLFGTDLAPSSVSAPDLPAPTELAGTSVLVNGIAAPLLFVSPNQINFQLPMELTGASISIRVHKRTDQDEVDSVAIPASLTIPEPALFSVDGSGTGFVQAFHSDGTGVSGDSPAQVGEVLTFLATGFGLLKDVPINVQLTLSDTGGHLGPATYFIRVTTILADGTESLGSGENQITVSTGNTSKISITWDAVDGAGGYRVYVGRRARGYDRYLESGTNSFDLVNIDTGVTFGTPPTQTNFPGNGAIGAASSISASAVGHDMAVSSSLEAPRKVGLFQLNLVVPGDLTPEVLGMQADQQVGFAEMRLIVGSIESNHLFLPVLRPPPPMINLSPASLSFTAQKGGDNPADQTVTLTKTGGGVLKWTAAADTGGTGNWLSVSPASGTNSATLTVSANISGLDAGVYQGTITVSDDNASNSPQTVMVTLTVTK